MLDRSHEAVPWLTPRRAGLALLVIGALGVTGASLVSLLGGWIWPFDLLAHFRVQYAGLLVLAVVAALLLRGWLTALGLGLLLVAHLVPLRPLVFAGDEPVGDGPTMRAVHINVLTSNTRVADTAAWLAEQDADVVVAQETDRRWVTGLDAGLDGLVRLPTETIRSDNFGLVVYVRDGIEVVSVQVVDPDRTPAIVAELALPDGRTTVVYAVHTLPPVGADNVEWANEQLERVAGTVNGHDGPALVVGDLNATRWGDSYQRLRSRVELVDSADGRGLQGTWPSPLWFTGMIGIDHVLVTPDVRVDDRFVGPDLGSDHRAVVVDVTFVAG
ncbi:MAG: endonuclease/exonuclease/phosphatase family protein [Actinomycetota bacterium]